MYTMIYIKSMLVGALTFVASAIAYLIVLSAVLMRTYTPPPGSEVGISLGAVVFRPSFWLIAWLAFAVGFYWEFRRASKN
jgi:hypothetical protein